MGYEEYQSRPRPGYKSEGCFNCGDGRDQILKSITNKGTSVALCYQCANHLDLKKMHTQPYNVRAGA